MADGIWFAITACNEAALIAFAVFPCTFNCHDGSQASEEHL